MFALRNMTCQRAPLIMTVVISVNCDINEINQHNKLIKIDAKPEYKKRLHSTRTRQEILLHDFKHSLFIKVSYAILCTTIVDISQFSRCHVFHRECFCLLANLRSSDLPKKQIDLISRHDIISYNNIGKIR